MNEFNVLLAAATNGTPSGSLFDALFARYIAPQESWRELESPLPITILAAGEDLIDYRIYGNTENGESVGEMWNVFNFEELMAAPSGWIGTIKFAHCLIMHLKPNTNYTMLSNGNGSIDGDADLSRSIYFNGTDATNAVFAGHPVTVMANSNGEVKVGILSERSNAQQYINNTAQVWCVEGPTAPTSYIPFGYKLPMVATNGAATTTTPIYIGSNPLAEDEYVDFGEQKIYRMEGGTLTPTDPPVPIPTLPTIQGETIIDYNPSTTPAVEPEKMYIKYKPQ